MFRFGIGRKIVFTDPTGILSKADTAGKETSANLALSNEINELVGTTTPDCWKATDGRGMAGGAHLLSYWRVERRSGAYHDLEGAVWFIPAENREEWQISHRFTCRCSL